MNFERTEQVIGLEALERLRKKRIILFGAGGVGGWCAEALVRSGVEHLTVVDFDVVGETNVNRQLVALAANIGQSKVEQLRERLLAINPEAEIVAVNKKYTPENKDEWQLKQYDCIVDAIDSLDCKMELILHATEQGIPLFSSMGAARKKDAGQVRIAEFWKVEGCPLARVLRTRMKKEKRLPKAKFLCVYSPEISSDSGSLCHVVATFGMRLAQLVMDSKE